ncbi:hypothetical protein QR680_002119 [Steinernema hermaphroditum]|uniref:USP domain-containing protein n=1 Tax=Steinernema hermaphroditum TaxID=289476 RepID=A0AA39H328_9BILA|nr:hypothetical protein QR680_002119 [Steinernema hermaphroditum]
MVHPLNEGTSPHIVKRLIQVLRLLWINDPSASNAVKKLVYDVAQSNYSLDVMKQQDVFEFMTLLFGKISASIDINMRSTEILLRNICTGVLQYTSRCTGCDYKRKSTERFTALSLPIPQKPLNEINVYAVTGDSVIAYGLRTQREPSVKEVITCIASDCRVSQNNCAVMAFNGNRLKVFDPQSLLVTAMNFPMFTVVEMTPDTTISNEIEALVFPRGDSITAPYVCAIDLKWAPATIWRRIVTTVFFWERGKTLPELGDIEVSVANKQGYFEQFVDRGRRGFHSLHPRHCFWRQNTSRKFIVLRIDLSSSQGALTLYPRSEYEHESYKANQGPLLDTLVETYFREERIPFTCRNCSSSSLIRTASIAECPQILFLHLNRFARNGSATLKVTSKLRIPRDVLDITDYTGFAASRRNSGCDEVERYHLCAVICHIGDSVSSGHYQCYRRNPVTQKWRLFSDSHVFPFEFPEFLSSSSAYFLIYEKPSNDSSVNEGHWFRKMNANDLISTVFHNYRM